MKCVHGDKWSECFCEAIENDRFSDECICNIASRMKGWFLSRAACREDAEDMSQELSIALSRYFRNFDHSKLGNGKAYVFAIARNICVQYLRKNDFHALSGKLEKSEDPRDRDIEEAVSYCIERLDPRQRLVVIYRDIEGLTIEDVVERTNIPPRSQHHYRQKAYESLKRCLKNQGFG